MRIFVTALIVLFNFILQSTLLPFLSIRGIAPNTALIIVVSYSLLRGQREGCMVGFATGILFDLFFGMYFAFYSMTYLIIGYVIGKNQKDFYRENHILPVLFSILATCLYEGGHFVGEWMLHKESSLWFFLFQIALPTIVYTALFTVPIYRGLFAVDEWLVSKERRLYRFSKK